MTNRLPPLRVLAVDDSAVDLRWLESQLRAAGCIVLTARDGAEALVRLIEEPLDVVVTDGLMPMVDGYELCRLVKDNPSLQGLPVILHTGDRTPMNRLWARICGADHFLFKTPDPEPLLTILASLPQREHRSPDREASPAPSPRTIQLHLARQLQGRLLESALRTTVASLYVHVREPEAVVAGLQEILADVVLPGCIFLILPLETGRQGFLMSSPGLPDGLFQEVLDSLGEWGRTRLWSKVEQGPPCPNQPLDHHVFLLSDPGTPNYGWWGVMMPHAALMPSLPVLSVVDEEFQRVYRTLMLLDQLVQANNLLQAADRRKSDFLRTVAHEIRNPLMAAEATLDLLPSALDMPERALRLTGTARRSVQRLLCLASGVLDLEKMEAGAFSCQREPVDLASVLAEIHEEYTSMATERRLELRLCLPNPAPPPILADRNRVTQCVVNLLSNGIRHSPETGTLTLSLACGAKEVTVAVQDQGPGVPEAFVSQLFQAFRQADPGAAKGTGLGLAITRALAEHMGGTVDYRPAPGGGAIFSLRFPVPDPQVGTAGGS